VLLKQQQPWIVNEIFGAAVHSAGRKSHGSFRSEQGPRSMKPFNGRMISVNHLYSRSHDLPRRLVLAQTLIRDLAQQALIGPGQKCHFGHELGSQASGCARGRAASRNGLFGAGKFKRHPRRRERFNPLAQPRQFCCVHARAGAARINEAPLRGVIGQQQGAEMLARAFRIGPAGDQEFLRG
jgi:hypothetical protein